MIIDISTVGVTTLSIRLLCSSQHAFLTFVVEWRSSWSSTAQYLHHTKQCESSPPLFSADFRHRNAVHYAWEYSHSFAAVRTHFRVPKSTLTSSDMEISPETHRWIDAIELEAPNLHGLVVVFHSTPEKMRYLG